MISKLCCTKTETSDGNSASTTTQTLQRGESKPAPGQWLVCNLQKEIWHWMIPKCIHSLTEVLLILPWHLPQSPLFKSWRDLLCSKSYPSYSPPKSWGRNNEMKLQTRHVILNWFSQSTLLKGAIPPTSTLSNNRFFLNDGKAQLRERYFENKHPTSKTCTKHFPSTLHTIPRLCRHLRNAAHISGIPSWTLKCRFREPQFKLQHL